jgi:group I intron endonuclease
MVIYKTTNLINEKIYIGKDKKNNPKYLGSGILLNNAIKKYGRENFKKEIIQECKSLEELNESETFWILKLESYKREIGYNISFGGEGGDTISNNPRKHEIGKKHSEQLRGKPSVMKGKNHSQETKEKLRLTSSGENNGMFGKHHTEETKKILRIKHTGKHLSEETKHKISESNIGKEGPWKGKKNEKHSEWMKNNNPFKGKKHTNETKEKIGVKNSKPKSEEHKKKISESLKGNIPGNIVKIEIEGIVYESLTEASEKLKLNYSTLRNRIKSKSKKFINYKIL